MLSVVKREKLYRSKIHTEVISGKLYLLIASIWDEESPMGIVFMCVSNNGFSIGLFSSSHIEAIKSEAKRS